MEREAVQATARTLLHRSSRAAKAAAWAREAWLNNPCIAAVVSMDTARDTNSPPTSEETPNTAFSEEQQPPKRRRGVDIVHNESVVKEYAVSLNPHETEPNDAHQVNLASRRGGLLHRSARAKKASAWARNAWANPDGMQVEPETEEKDEEGLGAAPPVASSPAARMKQPQIARLKLARRENAVPTSTASEGNPAVVISSQPFQRNSDEGYEIADDVHEAEHPTMNSLNGALRIDVVGMGGHIENSDEIAYQFNSSSYETFANLQAEEVLACRPGGLLDRSSRVRKACAWARMASTPSIAEVPVDIETEAEMEECAAKPKRELKRCIHDRRTHRCKECKGPHLCVHNEFKSVCKDCKSSQICEHNRVKGSCSECKCCIHGKRRPLCGDCGGSQVCWHGRLAYNCNQCKDVCIHQRKSGNPCNQCTICRHNNVRSECRDCKRLCVHDRVKYNCVECKGCRTCIHGKLKAYCRDCKGSSYCVHERRRQDCRDCNAASICPHGRIWFHCQTCKDLSNRECKHGALKRECRDCKGFCEHDRKQSQCKLCKGSKICEHGKFKYYCKECHGSQVCVHGRTKSYCKECKGIAVCIHSRIKYKCKECRCAGALSELAAAGAGVPRSLQLWRTIADDLVPADSPQRAAGHPAAAAAADRTGGLS